MIDSDLSWQGFVSHNPTRASLLSDHYITLSVNLRSWRVRHEVQKVPDPAVGRSGQYLRQWLERQLAPSKGQR